MLQRELASKQDYIDIDKIWQSFYSGEFGLPPLDLDTLYHTVIEDKGRLVGFGQIRATAESIMIINQEMSMRDKIETVRLILEKQLEGMIVKDITECHAFAQNPKFANLLIKHFGYVKTIGESLVLKI